jgi:SAM-dependent methyltransferase
MTRPWYRALYEHFPDYDDEPYVQNTEAEVDFIEEQIEGDLSRRILDVGCGTGRHALALGRRGYRTVGLDLSASFIRRGCSTARREGLQVSFLVGDARWIPFDGAFEVVLILCEGGFSLMEEDDMDRAILKGARRALKPGGLLVMTAPHAPFLIAHEPEGSAFDLVTFRERFQIEASEGEGRPRVLDASQRYYSCPELRCLLNGEGFCEIRFFGVTEAGYSVETAPTSDHFEVGVVARAVS